VQPNVGAKGEAGGGTPGPDGRQCTPYLPAGPGGTPLDLPLSDGLGGARSRTTIAGRPGVLSAERTAKKGEDYLAVWLGWEARCARPTRPMTAAIACQGCPKNRFGPGRAPKCRLTIELRGSPTAWRTGQQVQNGAQAPALDGQCAMPLGLPLERRVRRHRDWS
jgi:hypothetical protein